MKVQELLIKVPWGHIAAKAWGDEKDPIILAFHGLMDNAGSFDRLIELLPKCFYYVCLDLPGHGKSSYFPGYFPNYTINNVIAYKLITDHFKQKQYIIIGHSYGGQIGYLFAQLYPEKVEKLIMIDTVTIIPVPVSQFTNYLREKFDYCMELHTKLQNGKPRPSYTKEEVLRKIQYERFSNDISKEAALALFPRSVEEVEEGRFQFTVDPRMKNVINPLRDLNYIIQSLKRYPARCPVLIIFGTESEMQQVYFQKVITVLKKMKNVRIKYVKGNHDLHNIEPANVAPHVSKFILMKNVKL